MKSRGKVRRAIVAVMIGVLVGGGLLVVTPAGAQVAEAAATNWKKIWKKKLQPLADKRYYKKATSDAKYATKAETSAAFANYYTMGQVDTKLGNYYTKAQSDANYYTKAQSDARYAPYPAVIRGTYALGGTATAANQPFSDSIGFGVTLGAAPTVHYINAGTLPPAGCSGTVAAPDAAPGHLCVFESLGGNVTTRDIDNANGNHPLSSPFGANIWAYSTGAGPVFVYGSFAVRPGGPLAGASAALGGGSAVKDGAATGR